jgi:hypothetical protein
VGATRSIGLPRLRSKLFGSDQDLRIGPHIFREDSRGRFAIPARPRNLRRDRDRALRYEPLVVVLDTSTESIALVAANVLETMVEPSAGNRHEESSGAPPQLVEHRPCLSARACTDGSGATRSMKSRPFSPPTLLLAHARMKRSTPPFLSLFIWPAQLCDEMKRCDIWGRTEDAGHILTRSFGRSEVARRCELQLWHQQSPTSEYLA